MRQLTVDAVAPLGPDYVAELSRKRGQALDGSLAPAGQGVRRLYEPGAYDVHPYLLLNLGEKYDGMTTFAHEWGHAMHSLLANRAQPFELDNYATFIAQIASTGNEMLLANMLVERAKTKTTSCSTSASHGEFPRHVLPPDHVRRIPGRDPRVAEQGRGRLGREVERRIYIDILKRYHGPK